MQREHTRGTATVLASSYICYQVPTQSNEWDCGLFILHYAELFAQNPEKVIAAIQAAEVISHIDLHRVH